MKIFIYLFIFVSKIIENSLGTLRMIVVANGRKVLGAILQLVISLIWVLSTGIVVININQDPLKILFFCLGSLVGSYLGSMIEEKIALGYNMLTCITDVDNHMSDYMRQNGYAVTVLKGEGKESKKEILFIMIRRKQILETVKMLKQYDHQSLIISEVARAISEDYKGS